MSFYIQYPAGAAASSNASVGPNGSTAPTSSTEVAGVTPGGNLQPISVDNSGNQNVNVVSSVLPTGASTSALQTTGNSSLSTIATNTTGVSTAANQVTGNSSLATIATNTTGASTAALQTAGNSSLSTIASRTPALGQTTSANSVPVVIASDQSAVPVTGAFYQTTQPVSGTVTAVQPTGTNLHTVVDSGSITVSNFPGTQPVSGTVAVSSISGALPAGTNSIGTVTAVQPTAANLNATVTGSVVVTQATGTNLHTVVDSGTITTVSSATITPTKGTLTDNSGTTSATPSAATTMMAANSSRKYLLIQNDSTTATIWINFTTTAVASQPSIQLGPLGSLVMETGFVSTELVSVISTTASVPYTAKQA